MRVQRFENSREPVRLLVHVWHSILCRIVKFLPHDASDGRMMQLRPTGSEPDMIQHPNAFLVHQCLQAANAGDRQTLRALWADDIVWRVKGAGPWQGDIKGPDEIFE